MLTPMGSLSELQVSHLLKNATTVIALPAHAQDTFRETRFSDLLALELAER